jgi:hypothetical protein
VRLLAAVLAFAAAAAFLVTYRDHRSCEDAREAIFQAALEQGRAGPDGSDDELEAGRGAGGLDDEIEAVRARCRGTVGLVAVSGALAALGDRDQALRLAREAAASEPDNAAAWRAVAASASGAEARAAEARLAALDPRSLNRNSGRSTRE